MTSPLAPNGTPWPPRAAGPASYVPLYGPDFERDPLRYYQGLREKYGPVVPVEVDERGGFRGWLVLGHREQLSVLHNESGLWTHDSRWWRDLAERRVPSHPILPQLEPGRHALTSDGAEHARLRGAVSQTLAQLRPPATRAYIDHLADQLIDALPSFGPVDIFSGYAAPLPLLVMMGLLGMSEPHAALVSHAIHQINQAGPESEAASRQVDKVMREMIAEKRRAPAADLTSWLIACTRMAHPDEDELADQTRLLLFSGLGASSAWIVSTVLKLLTDEEAMRETAAGRRSVAEVASQALGEQPPVQNTFYHWAQGPMQLGGREIGTGDMAIVSLAAVDPSGEGFGGPFAGPGADRPPAPGGPFEAAPPREGAGPEAPAAPGAAGELRVQRARMAWGAGPHACPARGLGLAIVDSAVSRLLHRLPGMHLAVEENELAWLPPHVVRVPAELPVLARSRRPAADPGEPAPFVDLPPSDHPPAPAVAPFAPGAAPVGPAEAHAPAPVGEFGPGAGEFAAPGPQGEPGAEGEAQDNGQRRGWRALPTWFFFRRGG
ncbi:cytochrome P450 [Streptomyces hoynatensis]|uniref:Cytochrome P450 n=1 Tax=Streptomyces hoynatensis TaxID=1141874 RepID=A0A3A9YX97_9ACTN|nr:cytochrome P450 [Streptomyces hoynatensis]RKN40429.1 cytochrome P450 [Streptomyces hoynatensis]